LEFLRARKGNFRSRDGDTSVSLERAHEALMATANWQSAKSVIVRAMKPEGKAGFPACPVLAVFQSDGPRLATRKSPEPQAGSLRYEPTQGRTRTQSSEVSP